MRSVCACVCLVKFESNTGSIVTCQISFSTAVAVCLVELLVRVVKLWFTKFLDVYLLLLCHPCLMVKWDLVFTAVTTWDEAIKYAFSCNEVSCETIFSMIGMYALVTWYCFMHSQCLYVAHSPTFFFLLFFRLFSSLEYNAFLVVRVSHVSFRLYEAARLNYAER